MAIDEIGISGACGVGDVGRIHPHRSPIDPILEPLVFIREQTGKVLPLEIEMALIYLHAPKDRLWRKLAVVGQNDDMLAVRLDGVGACRIDHDRAVMSKLLLEAGMAVVPIGAVLTDGKLVEITRSRLNSRKGHARNAVMLGWHEKAMPVNRAVFVEIDDHVEPHCLAFTKADERGRHGAIDADRG